jgi:membrane fusion protein, multidrug efflux system
MEGPDGSYVYAIKPDQTVEQRKVVVASTQDGRSVIDKGLNAGDRIVVDGQYRLADGARIAPSGGGQQAAQAAAGVDR